MENPIKMDDFGGPPLFLDGHPYGDVVIQLVAQQFLTADSRNVGNEMWQRCFVAGATPETGLAF